ncbi:MAG: hypothetical protein ACK5O6_00090, partial [Betaproteobacteria bacterium]
DFPLETAFDFAFFDTSTDIRQAEFARFFPSLVKGATIIFQNTREPQTGKVLALEDLIARFGIVGIDLATPRGLWLGRKC